jgi:DNA-directed RNA polymerase specialized sigma24 family protein
MGKDDRGDLELLAAARTGDALAFGVFFRRHRAVVLAFLGRRTRNSELAADLLAESFAAALGVVLDW